MNTDLFFHELIQEALDRDRCWLLAKIYTECKNLESTVDFLINSQWRIRDILQEEKVTLKTVVNNIGASLLNTGDKILYRRLVETIVKNGAITVDIHHFIRLVTGLRFQIRLAKLVKPPGVPRIPNF